MHNTPCSCLEHELLMYHNMASLLLHRTTAIQLSTLNKRQRWGASTLVPLQSVSCAFSRLTRHGHLLLLQRSNGTSSTELHYSYERTRTTVTAGLCKQLKDLMGDFQAVRKQLTDDHRWALAFTRPSIMKQARNQKAESLDSAMRPEAAHN